MRSWLLISTMLVATIALGSRAQAQNYPWCAQYSGEMGGATNCGFVSFDQCMLTVRGIGGFCVVNNRYQPAVSPAPRRGASGRHGSVS
ncbi:MAG: DUF3551 domain-containing protein [Xanthobacteraceae bacterium]